MPNSSGPTTPSDVYNSFVLTDKDKEELEGFSIPPAMSFPSKSGESKLEKEKDRSMFSKSLRL